MTAIVFIVGPYRADTHDGVRANVDHAAGVARRCWAAGVPAICPHLNSAWFSGVVEEEVFLEGYRAILSRCDAVLTVPGWDRSAGALCELETAKVCGKPIFHELDKLLAWVERNASIARRSSLARLLTEE